MLRRIWTVIQKEFIQTFRDRRTLVIQLSMPIIQLLLMGYAIDMNVDHWTTTGQNPDERSNKFKDAAIKDFSRVGYIGLQDHGQPVWYRNIRIKRLSSN